MSQTLAMLVDSYRELNSRKMFWITLALSAVVVLVFLAIGIDENGIYLFGSHFPGPQITTDMLARPLFYKFVFIGLGVNIWLSFAAAILALISTSGMFPDLLTGGSIELYFSKPISRARIFITKFLSGLLFATLQILVFCVASLFVLRIRGGEWVPAVFLALPAVLAYFSYLYAICVLVGVKTRSTVAAILITVLSMLGLYGLHKVETAMLVMQFKNEIVLHRLQSRKYQDPAEIKSAEDDVDFAHRWQSRLNTAQAFLPRTAETIGLMERWIVSTKEFQQVSGADSNENRGTFWFSTDDQRAAVKAEAIQRARPLSQILGMSFLFEAVIVFIAGWIFCRQDY